MSAPPGKRWAFRLLAATVVPLCLLGGLEGALRLAGVGYPTAFLVPLEESIQPGMLRDNPSFAWQYFPRTIARRPVPVVLPAEPPPGELRVFVLGGSAAMGDPEPAFGFARMLQVLPDEQPEGTTLRVVNAAMTAINSHVVREVGRDCVDTGQADALILYLGNNEVVGPHGPGSVLGAFRRSLTVLRASQWARRTRVGQVLESLLRPDDGSAPVSWRGMEMFLERPVPAGAAELQVTYDHFRANLEDTCRRARAAGVRVLLCTVAVNLKDCPPFGSAHDPELPPEDAERWEQLLEQARALEAEGAPEAALERYDACTVLDAQMALGWFLRGRCLLALGQEEEARRSFQEALDRDTLRFRADSRINEIIREVAARIPGVELVDLDAELRQASPAGITGNELLYEHVHLTPAGNHRAAVALARALGLIPTDPAQEPDLTTVQRRLGWNEWERLQLEEQLLERSRHAPFTDQLGHDAAVAAQEHQVEALSEHVARHSTPSLEQVYRTALEARPSDWMVREHLARFLQSRGSHRAAIQALRGVQEQLPHHDEIPVMLGVSLAQVGEGDAARVAFEEALQLNPEHGLAHFNLGRLLHAGGDLLTAEAHYRRALLLRPSLGEIPYQLGRLLGETGRRAEAIVQLEHALDLGPGRPDVELALAMELWRSGRPDDAARHLMTLERAARRRGDPGTAAQLGTLLERVQAGQAAPAPGD